MLLNKKVPLTYILNKIKFDFISVLVLAVVIELITEKYKLILPEIPLTIPAFIGTSISIILSFKLNQSYDRWWEARKVWGSIVNDSRSFVLQLNTLVEKGNDPLIRKIAFRQIAWCYSLGQSLRGLNPLDNTEEFLSGEDAEEIKQHNNKPLAMLQLHGIDIKALKEKNQLDVFSQLQLDNTIVRFCESQGKAERIKNTIFPVTYRMFLHFMIYLFVITLSFSLENIGGYYEIPLLILISMAFFLLEKSATHMQDPFDNKPTDTAMTAIARTIEINIKQLLKETNIPKPLAPNRFYMS